VVLSVFLYNCGTHPRK